MGISENYRVNKLLFEDKETACYAVLEILNDDLKLKKTMRGIDGTFTLDSSDESEVSLFTLEKGNKLIDKILGEKKVIILTVAKEHTVETIREHLVLIKNAILESGDMIDLPIYDPKFLIRFFPSCNEKDAETIFGPIEKHIIWTQDDSNSLLAFSKGKNKVTSELIEL